MGKAARQWPERIKLTLNSVVLLAFCFCTLHTMTLLRVPVFWLSFTNIRFYIFYTCLSKNHSQMLGKTYFITIIIVFLSWGPNVGSISFSNNVFKLSLQAKHKSGTTIVQLLHCFQDENTQHTPGPLGLCCAVPPCLSF